MTTAVTPTEQVPQPVAALAIPPISADLLPAEVVQGRKDKRVRRMVLAALGVVVLLLAGWYVLARHATADARVKLADAQAAQQRVESQKKNYSDVVQVQQDVATVNGQLKKLMATDLRWSTVVVAVQRVAPAGITLTGLNGIIEQVNKNAPAASASSSTGLLSGADTVGSLTINGIGGTKDQVAAYVDLLGRIPGLKTPLLSSAAATPKGIEFTVRLDLTRSLFGGRFSGGN